jgi:uncharacterized protein (DUF885 family)
MKKYIFWGLTVLFSCEVKKEDKLSDINKLADDYVDLLFKYDPQWGTFYGIDNADNVNLTDISADGLKKRQDAEDLLLQKMLGIVPSNLSHDDRNTYEILKEVLESSRAARVCQSHLWTIHQMDAFYLWFNYIAETQPVGDSITRQNAIKRWKKIPKYIESDMANNKQGLESGYALPRIVIEQVIAQLDQLLVAPIDRNVFYIMAKRDESETFKRDIEKIVVNEIMPLIRTYRDFLHNEYLPKARIELSISTIPNGNECYAAMLRSYTSLSASPETVYNWGVSAIESREKKIREIGEQVYQTNDLNKIRESLKADSSVYLKNKNELLKFAQSSIDRAKLRITDYFGIIPKSDVILEPIPAIEEATGYSRYLPASDDGKRPAKYVQQTSEPKSKTIGEIESTAFHETYPGHHLQIAISREISKSHNITKYVGNSGFSEGWARYTETLSDEMGLYSSEKSSLSMFMGLPTGMVVDPGIHFKNWTREEAIEYTLSKQASMTKKDAENYVDRIAVIPGQMTTYGVGEMYFINLRKEAETKLKDKFNIKTFHDNCLKNGTTPLNYLDVLSKNWIETTSKD